MIKRKLSMPFWCVANPVGDPSGPAVMDRISSLETCDLLCKARAEKLIDCTAGHAQKLFFLHPGREEGPGPRRGSRPGQAHGRAVGQGDGGHPEGSRGL